PASQHVVRKPNPAGRQADREPGQPGPLNATTRLTAIPARPAPSTRSLQSGGYACACSTQINYVSLPPGLNGALQPCREMTLSVPTIRGRQVAAGAVRGRGQALAWPVVAAAEGPQRSPGSRPARRAAAAGGAQQPGGRRGGPVSCAAPPGG